MEFILNRYRNISVLVLVLAAQFFLLAYQVKTRQDIRPIRVWAMGGFMPLARVADVVRDNTIGLVDRYADLLQAQAENQKLREEIGKLRLENQYLKTELSTADRGKGLALFQARSPQRTLPARIVGTSTAPGAKVVFVDRGTNDGVRKGMAVITPEGIAGKVTAAHPTGSQVTLITDPSFAAGVISGKGRVVGILKGQGHGTCLVDYVQNEETVSEGEMFFTSGDDLIFPKGLPVGKVRAARTGKNLYKEIFVVPAGLERSLEDVLIIVQGVHQQLSTVSADASQPPVMMTPPPADPKAVAEAERARNGALTVEADHVFEKHKRSRYGTPAGAAEAAAPPRPPQPQPPPRQEPPAQ
jgi:rod shape-determining protein MreC